MRHSSGILATAALQLTACGGSSSSPPPTVSLTASPSAVGSGESSTLAWSSTDATSCTASGGWSGTLPTSGSQLSSALTADTTFRLTCAGPGGASPVAAATVTVNSPPTVSLNANPTVIATGGSTTLTWSSTNATDCTASGGWTGRVATSGTQNTGSLSADSAYSLSCSGPDGTSPVATATVIISNTVMSLSPSIAAITLVQTQQFTATVPGGGPATWMVDGVAGGNDVVGTVSSTGLYTPGTGAGAHTIVATSVANATQSASSVAAVTDLPGVYTYHNNLSRDGANTQEYALTKSTVNTAHFGKRAACAADGAIYGQPLWVPDLTVSGAKHNVVFVATQHDGLFAFDADASPCVKLWSVNLIDSAHGGLSGETTVPGNLVGGSYGNIQPEVGVTGTPVIDPSSGILYVVTKSVNSAQTTYYQRLHAIDLTTGNEKTGSPVTIAGTYPGTGDGGTTVSFDAHQEHQRSGLALVNGNVYIAWTSHEDEAPWYGWIMSYRHTGTALTQQAIINLAPNAQKAGVWMGGGAPAVDSNNNLYVITGNGSFNATSTGAPSNDYGNTLLQLTPALTVAQWFTPSNQLINDQNDKDFGSGGAALLADLPAGNKVTHALICGGKDHGLFVLNRDLLGGFGDAAAVQTLDFGSAIFSTGAFWNSRFYLAGLNAPLQAYQLNPATVQFSKASSSSHTYGFPGATPSISSSATQNGIVWSLDNGQYCTNRAKGCGPAVLYAHDATHLATELWNSGHSSTDAAGNAVKFTVPTIANGRVYVGTRGNNAGLADNSTSTPGELDIYGLKP
jgi:hypothetical protein